MILIKNNILVSFLLSFVCFTTWSQEPPVERTKKGKERIPTYFGLQVKPIFPASWIGTKGLDFDVENFNVAVKQIAGYSLGGVIRFGITKTIAIETGISTTQRRYNIISTLADSNLYADQNIRFVTYEIPVNALFYIRLAEKVYMNASVGGGIVYNPSLARVRYIEPNSNHHFIHTTLAKKVQFNLSANLGVEYRTKSAGIFYLGGIFNIPVKPLFYMSSIYQNEGFQLENDAINQGRVNGTYLAFEIKYFLPFKTKSKTPPVPKGPIEF